MLDTLREAAQPGLFIWSAALAAAEICDHVLGFHGFAPAIAAAGFTGAAAWQMKDFFEMRRASFLRERPPEEATYIGTHFNRLQFGLMTAGAVLAYLTLPHPGAFGLIMGAIPAITAGATAASHIAHVRLRKKLDLN